MSQRRPSALVAALGLFSVIPVPAVASIDRPLAGRAMLALPGVGVVLGLAAGVVVAGLGWLGLPLMAGVAAVAVLAALTGGLHLDGIADTADGLGSRRPAEEALAIMKRSDIGPMGVITLVMVLLLDVAAVGHLGGAGWRAAALTVAVAAVVARVPVVAACATGRDARPGGFGSLFHHVVGPAGVAVTVAWTLALALGCGWLASGGSGAAVVGGSVVVAWGVALAWRAHLVRRLGGMTGDTFGSLIEVTQCATLTLAAVGFTLTS